MNHRDPNRMQPDLTATLSKTITDIKDKNDLQQQRAMENNRGCSLLLPFDF